MIFVLFVTFKLNQYVHKKGCDFSICCSLAGKLRRNFRFRPLLSKFLNYSICFFFGFDTIRIYTGNVLAWNGNKRPVELISDKDQIKTYDISISVS